jgi:parallel beta-helix repeat protein
MRVRAELTPRQLVLALLLLAVLPGLATATALAYHPPAPPPGPPAYDPVALPDVPLRDALYVRELQRSERVAAVATHLTTPRLLPAVFPEPGPTLALAPRRRPYSLAELVRRVPEAFEPMVGAVLVRDAIEVPAGATLVIDSATTPDVRLLSSPDRFASLMTQGGNIAMRGSWRSPARISSWDPRAGRRDEVPEDGRAFVLDIGGRMDLAHADVRGLGFGTGSTSGVAWRGADHPPGTPRLPATGDVSNSVLHENWFGAFTFEAEAMRWTGNTFARNGAYGFDPHDLSNDFVVTDNVAYGNGRHGFIFSRGCDNNVLSHNVSRGNRGHGFMIDDGRTEDPTRLLASDDNLLVGNVATDNGGNGIEIEGGTRNVVRSNVLVGNHVGVRVKDGASATIERNRISDSSLSAVDVFDNAAQVRVVGNDVHGGWAGVVLGRAAGVHEQDNRLSGTSAPLVVEGRAVRSRSPFTVLGEAFRWKPLLILWTVILGWPVLRAARSLARARLRRRRHPVPEDALRRTA